MQYEADWRHPPPQCRGGVSLVGGCRQTVYTRWIPRSDARLRLRQLDTDQLSLDEQRTLRHLLNEAFGADEFSDEDWQHALGGVHFVLDADAAMCAHASVVERSLHVADRALRTGYVEAVATAPAYQGLGYGTRVMRAVGVYIAEHFDIGALGTGRHGFYERLNWRTWRGPSSVRTARGERRTRDEDGYIMVLTTNTTRDIDLTLPISCEWRPGDVW
jgi:aminoglycoside 2'-N-acetyltransferase I